jgi:hypothetical protein
MGRAVQRGAVRTGACLIPLLRRDDYCGRSSRPAGGEGTEGEAVSLADQIERLPLSSAAEVLNWLSLHLDRLEHEAERILGVQP